MEKKSFTKWIYSLNPNSLYISDPITYLFRGILKLKPSVSTIIYLLVTNLPIIIGVWLAGYLSSRNGTLGLSTDYGWWAFQVILIPVIVNSFFWLPDGINKVYKTLEENQAIVIYAEKNKITDWEAFFIDFNKSYTNVKWTLLVAILDAIYMIFFFYPSQMQIAFKIWQAASPFIFWYTFGTWAVVFFISGLFAVRIIIAMSWINILFKRIRIKIQFFHEDGAGGLAPLGKFVVRMGYLLGIQASVNAFGNYSESAIRSVTFLSVILQPHVLSIWFIYLFILIPLVFFFPLITAHRAMVIAKTDYITMISSKLEKELEKTSAVFEDGRRSLVAYVENITHLLELQVVATKFPTWPINLNSAFRFFSSVLSPVILTIATLIVDILK